MALTVLPTRDLVFLCERMGANERACIAMLRKLGWAEGLSVTVVYGGTEDFGAWFDGGTYWMIDSIGRGGMGQVFKAQHEVLGRVVAVKVLPRSKSTPTSIANFMREIQVLAKLDPDDPVNWLQRGGEHVLRQDGDDERAIEDLTRVIELDPDIAIAYVWRAISYSRNGAYESAIEDCRKALELKPDDSQTFRTLAWAYWQAGHREEARAAIEELSARTESWHSKRLVVEGRKQIADFYHKIGDYERAEAEAAFYEEDDDDL